MSSAYPNPLYFFVIACITGSITRQNNSIERGSPCGTPHSILSAKRQCLSFRKAMTYFVNRLLTPFFLNACIIASYGTELKAFLMSIVVSASPWLLSSSALAKLRTCAFFLKAYCASLICTCYSSCLVSNLCKTNSIGSHIAMGLAPPSFFGMNTSLKLYSSLT